MKKYAIKLVAAIIGQPPPIPRKGYFVELLKAVLTLEVNHAGQTASDHDIGYNDKRYSIEAADGMSCWAR